MFGKKKKKQSPKSEALAALEIASYLTTMHQPMTPEEKARTKRLIDIMERWERGEIDLDLADLDLDHLEEWEEG